MRRISSKWTFFYKRIFPVIFFGFLVVFIGIALFANLRSNSALDNIPFLIVPIVMTVIVFFISKKLIFDLADEVWEDGDTLVVRNFGQEQRIALADIKNVNYSPLISPPRVTLSLRRPTVFGDEVTFCAPVRLVPLAPNPVINDLIERVDRAREQSHHRR
jgi:hypothetical protein